MLRARAVDEEKTEKPWEEQSIPRLALDNVPRSGDFPLRASGLTKSYGSKALFREFDLQLSSQARVAICGVNGAGKTTLLRILAGLETADAGSVTLSAGARAGSLFQDGANPDLNRTPLQVCGSTTLARTLMGCLKLRPDCVNRSLLDLSPGERAKTALVRLLASGANLLLLDEPTEHLEIEAQEALEQALREYPGAVVVVSHDAEFLNALGPGLEVIQLAGHSAPIRVP
jgi:ATPase subunit of ABC transporter with duplicated ATPase domains